MSLDQKLPDKFILSIDPFVGKDTIVKLKVASFWGEEKEVFYTKLAPDFNQSNLDSLFDLMKKETEKVLFKKS